MTLTFITYNFNEKVSVLSNNKMLKWTLNPLIFPEKELNYKNSIFSPVSLVRLAIAVS